MFPIGMPEAFIIFLIILLIFGPSKLPELAKSVGSAMKQFRQASREALADDEPAMVASAGSATPHPVPASNVPEAPDTAAPTPVEVTSTDKVTLHS
jgi:sec-independent protein translocase protein TatA